MHVCIYVLYFILNVCISPIVRPFYLMVQRGLCVTVTWCKGVVCDCHSITQVQADKHTHTHNTILIPPPHTHT